MSQAALLAQRDSLSPFRVVFATSAVSLVGDLVFIGRLGMGVVGAAWTTVLAQASPGGGGVAWHAAWPRADFLDAASRPPFLLTHCCQLAASLPPRYLLPPLPLPLPPPALCAQYLGAALLLGALSRSRVAPRVRIPSLSELRLLADTFGILTLFYGAKNLSYLLIQVRWLCGAGA